MRKPVFGGLLRTKAQTDQQFVIQILLSIISRLATSKISIVLLVSIAEETGLNLALSETPNTGFLTSRPK